MRGISELDKYNHLRTIIELFSFAYDIIVFTEVKLKSNFPLNIYQLPGYKTLSCLRSALGGGGVVLFVRNTIKIDDYKTTRDSYEKISMNITADEMSCRLIAVYRPPVPSNLSRFMSDLETEISENFTKTIIVGDINIDSNPQRTFHDRATADYLDLLSSYNYSILNIHQTRPTSGRMIDHVIANFNENENFKNFTIEVDPKISDHNIIVSMFELPKKLPRSRQVISRSIIDLKYLERNFQSACDKFSNDPESISNDITESIKNATLKSSRSLPFNIKHNENLSEWTSKKTLNILREKDKILKKHRKRPASEKVAKDLETITKILDKSMKNDYNRYVTNKLTTKNTKTLWNNLNTILGRNQRTDKIEISSSKGLVCDDQKVADELNNYFSGCIADLKKQSGPPEPQKVEISPASSMLLEPVTTAEILSIIRSLKNNSSTGHDGISTKVIKKLSHKLAPDIVILINTIFETGVYPSQFKLAMVTPLFKGGNKSSVENFRPISVLTILNKIVEKALYKRIFGFVNNKLNLIYRYQYGFRPRSNTETAAIELSEEILTSLDNNEIATGVFMDLKKAFDVVDHTLLIEVLMKYGIRGKSLNVFESYLSGRTQQVKIGNHKSSIAEITSGVVQGSCLGPLLYLIFFNAIGSLNLKGKIFLFADDAVLINTHNDTSKIAETVKSDMIQVMNFFVHRQLFLNEKKTNFMVFRSSQSRKTLPQTIDLTPNISISRVKTTKYLGLQIDEHLKWSDHTKQLETKISKSCGALWKLRRYLPEKSKKLIYDSLIQSNLSYMISLWGTANWSALQPLQILQNRALRNVYDLPTHSNRIHTYSHLVENHLPVRGLYVTNVGTFIYKAINNLIHTNLAFPRNAAMNLKNLRHGSNLHPTRSRNNYGSMRISSAGPRIFNKIPNEIKSCKNEYAFKWCLKCSLRKEDFISNCFSASFKSNFETTAESTIR